MDQKILIRIHTKLLRNRSTGKYSYDRLNASATNRQQDHRSSSVRKSELPPISQTSTCPRSLRNQLVSVPARIIRVEKAGKRGSPATGPDYINRRWRTQYQTSTPSWFRSLYFSLTNILPNSFKTNGPKLLINFLFSFNFLPFQITFTLNSPL
jgi:hypothetical protein